jgi:hypothetical protein
MRGLGSAYLGTTSEKGPLLRAGARKLSVKRENWYVPESKNAVVDPQYRGGRNERVRDEMSGDRRGSLVHARGLETSPRLDEVTTSGTGLCVAQRLRPAIRWNLHVPGPPTATPPLPASREAGTSAGKIPSGRPCLSDLRGSERATLPTPDWALAIRRAADTVGVLTDGCQGVWRPLAEFHLLVHYAKGKDGRFLRKAPLQAPGTRE